jgi:predicted anti-sigma-YlaC factor YlaD
MTCQELDERLDDFVDGRLGERESGEVQAHLAGCTGCRERAQQLRQLLAHAAALPRALAPPSDLWPGIRERVERRSAWTGFWTSWQPLALAAAAAAVAALAAFLWSGSGPSPIRTVAMPDASPSLRPVAAGTAPSDPLLAQAVREYELATSALLEALQRRRSVLSADDLARVEANLQVIDRALADVREALVKDPEDPKLNHMLVATHKKKVDVLRRVVRLSTAL